MAVKREHGRDDDLCRDGVIKLARVRLNNCEISGPFEMMTEWVHPEVD